MDLIGRRRYFFCRHCGSFHFPEIVDEGVRVLQRDGSGDQCGVCKQTLAAAEMDDGHEVQYCERCRGVLLSRAQFAEIVERRRAWASTPPVTPMPLDRRELERSIACPGCREPMARHPYFGPGNVILDTCDRCALVWLDFGELKQIVDTPGQDRGRRPGPGGNRDEPDLLQILADRYGTGEKTE